MATREVVVELKLGDTQAVTKFEELTREMKKLALEKTNLGKELRSLDKEFRALEQTEKRLGKATPEVTAAIQANRKAFDDTAKTIAQAELKYENLRVQHRELKNDLSGATASGLRFRDVMRESIVTGVEPLTNGIESLQMALRVVKQEASRAFQEFGAGSVEFRRASEKLDELEDKLIEFNAATKLVDLDGKLELATQAAAGAASAFSAVQGALALVGSESEDVEKAMLRVQGAIALATGLQGLATMAKQLKGIGLALGLVETGAAGAAGGVKLFGLALTSTGIGVAIAAVGALAAALVVMASDTADATEEFNKLFDTLEKRRQAFNLQLDANIQLQKIRQDILALEGSITQEQAAQSKDALDRLGITEKISKLERDREQVLGRIQEIQKEMSVGGSRFGALNAGLSDSEKEKLKELRERSKELDTELVNLRNSYQLLAAQQRLNELQEGAKGESTRNETNNIEINTQIIQAQTKALEEQAELRERLLAQPEDTTPLDPLKLGLTPFNLNEEAEGSYMEALARKAQADKDEAAAFMALQEAKRSAVQDFSNALVAFSQLAKQDSQAQKALAVASALTNTYLAVTQILANKTVLPEPAATAQKAISIAGALATGLSAVAKIQGFAQGGVVERNDGTPIRRSNGDNVLITAKAGEVILNDRQQKHLEELNGGGIWKLIGVPGFATGGFVPQPTPEQLIRVEQTAETRAINFAPMVSVVEINEVQNRVGLIENETRL